MSFMQPQVIEDLFVHVESEDGDWVVPADVVGLTAEGEVSLTDEMRVQLANTAPEGIGCVAEVDILEAEVRKEWGGRLSASGYMDCTDWTTGTREEVLSNLAELYDWFWCANCEEFFEFPCDSLETEDGAHEVCIDDQSKLICKADL